MSPHTPILSVPSPAHHRVSGSHDLIGSSMHGQEMKDSMGVERREVEGIGKRHASTHWLYSRLSVPWPTCDGQEDHNPDNSPRRNRATEFPQSISASHTLARPGLQPTAIQSKTSYPHINSTQPTYHPVMVVTSMERESDAERIRGGGIRCCGFTIAGPQGKKRGIEIDPLKSNGQSQLGPPASNVNQAENATPMREAISRPMTPQGASRSRAASQSSPKSGPGAPAGSRSRRPSQAQAADGAKEPPQRAPRSRTPSQVAEPRPRAQSGAKEPRSRAGSMSQSRSRANSRAGQSDSNRPRLHSHHLSSTAPTLPPVPSPVTPINLGYS